MKELQRILSYRRTKQQRLTIGSWISEARVKKHLFGKGCIFMLLYAKLFVVVVVLCFCFLGFFCTVKCQASGSTRDAIIVFVLLASKSAGGEEKVQEQQGTVAINRISQSHASFRDISTYITSKVSIISPFEIIRNKTSDRKHSPSD